MNAIAASANVAAAALIDERQLCADLGIFFRNRHEMARKGRRPPLIKVG